MKNSQQSCNFVAKKFQRIYFFGERDSKMKYAETPVSCFSARNFQRIYFLEKETVR